MKPLIISATSGNNLALSKKIQKIGQELKIDFKLVNLEDFPLPLYTPEEDKEDNLDGPLKELYELISPAPGCIWVAPEYNGGTPPIMLNAITWLSRCGEDWRSAFNEKVAVLGTHSGGGGQNFISHLRSTLEFIGTLVLPRAIVTNYKRPLSEDSARTILTQFKKLTSL